MRKNNLKLSNRLLLNYIMVSVLAAVCTFFIFFGYVVYNVLGSGPKVILNDGDYGIEIHQNDEINDLIKYGGFYEILNDNFEIVYEKNSIKDVGYKYSTTEFLKVIITEEMDGYNLEVKFDLNNNNIIVMGLPEDVKGIAITVKKFDKAGMKEALKKSISLIMLLFIMISILVYAKISSKTFVKPIMELLDGFDKMKNGEYTTRIKSKDNVKEFNKVKEAFNHMAERIQHESDLKNKSERVRKQMILDISHDLKNPLTSIQGYSEFLIKNDNLNRDKKLEILKTINKNSIRANSLINELFEYSKLQNQKYTLDKKNQDISELMREIIASYISPFEDAGFEYDIKIPDESIFINFDWKEMDRAISNIINNSLKYNEKGTKIEIELADKNELIKILIKDDGIGIPDEFKESIFEPFVRVDESRNSNTGGTGLGLAIAQNIISRHHGIIKLKDSIKGCEFEIILSK